MPIRINLLAEALAEEELRRKDPIKRAIGIGVILVLLMLLWCSSLQLKSMIIGSGLKGLEAQISSRSNEYAQVTQSSRKLADINHKLESLHRLACTRLLYGNLLNALQHTVIPDVQLMRFRTEQTYVLTEAVKAKTNGSRIIAGKPATSTERIVLTLDAKDSSVNPGDQVNKFKQAVAECPYFRTTLGTTNEVLLTSLSPPVKNVEKPYEDFTLQCRYPEQTR